jgi:superfamily II DNA or RNA helicase
VITVEIGNSYSRIKGLSAKEEKELKALLSYTVGGSSAYFSGYGVRKKSLLDKYGNFPSGLLHRIPYAVKISDLRLKPPPVPHYIIPGISPYEWQTEAVKAAYKVGKGIITAPTGTGKSLAMAMLIAKYNLKTLVVVPSIEIKKQLQETFQNYGLRKVTISNIDATELKTEDKYDVLIIDEAHHAATKTYRMLNKKVWHDIYHRFFFTATPFRNDTEETLLFESIAGQVIYKLDYKTALSKDYIVPIEAFYIDLPKQKTDAFTWAEVYRELVVDNEARNTKILDLLLSLSVGNKSALCLVKEVRHGKNIGFPHFVSGEDEESRKLIQLFNNNEIKTLVATTGIMGEGVDSKPCEFVIIAGLGKAKSQFMQQVGRAVRRYPGKESAKIIIFRDTSHKFTLRHFNEQKKILKEEYGITLTKLEV